MSEPTIKTRFVPKVIMVAPDKLRPAGFNPEVRIQNERKIKYLMDTIKEVGGIIQPLTISQDNIIIDGHRRREAAKRLGMSEVPCIVSPLSLQVGWRILNDPSEPITPKDWAQAYVQGMSLDNVPRRSRKQIKAIEELCGLSMVEAIAQKQISPNVYDEARRLARYVERKSARDDLSLDVVRKCLAWLVNLGQQAAARRALKAEMSPRVLLYAIDNGESLDSKGGK